MINLPYRVISLNFTYSFYNVEKKTIPIISNTFPLVTKKLKPTFHQNGKSNIFSTCETFHQNGKSNRFSTCHNLRLSTLFHSDIYSLQRTNLNLSMTLQHLY